jgi:hypothetical protein
MGAAIVRRTGRRTAMLLAPTSDRVTRLSRGQLGPESARMHRAPSLGKRASAAQRGALHRVRGQTLFRHPTQELMSHIVLGLPRMKCTGGRPVVVDCQGIRWETAATGCWQRAIVVDSTVGTGNAGARRCSATPSCEVGKLARLQFERSASKKDLSLYWLLSHVTCAHLINSRVLSHVEVPVCGSQGFRLRCMCRLTGKWCIPVANFACPM